MGLIGEAGRGDSLHLKELLRSGGVKRSLPPYILDGSRRALSRRYVDLLQCRHSLFHMPIRDRETDRTLVSGRRNRVPEPSSRRGFSRSSDALAAAVCRVLPC